MALVSSPPPHRPVQSSQQVGSAAQKHIVEVGDPLLRGGRPGLGPLGPSAPVPTPYLCLLPHFPESL